MFSFPECIAWLAVGLTECVATATLNIITVIVFMKYRNLRKRNTYLIINLAVVDMLVGGIATHDLFYFIGGHCNVWKYNFIEGWVSYVLYSFLLLFPLSSLTTITAISIERLHATLRPFRHRVLKNIVYKLIIAVVWVTATVITISIAVRLKFKGASYVYLWNSYIAICLLVICISYSSIVIKVRGRVQPQHHGAASRERKLTMTLLIVTVVSLLLYLPHKIYWYLVIITDFEILTSMSYSSLFHLGNAIFLLFYANSLVNPILYAIRMPEYRSAVLALFRRRPQQQRQVADLPLHNL